MIKDESCLRLSSSLVTFKSGASSLKSGLDEFLCVLPPDLSVKLGRPVDASLIASHTPVLVLGNTVVSLVLLLSTNTVFGKNHMEINRILKEHRKDKISI